MFGILTILSYLLEHIALETGWRARLLSRPCGVRSERVGRER